MICVAGCHRGVICSFVSWPCIPNGRCCLLRGNVHHGVHHAEKTETNPSIGLVPVIVPPCSNKIGSSSKDGVCGRDRLGGYAARWRASSWWSAQNLDHLSSITMSGGARASFVLEVAAVCRRPSFTSATQISPPRLLSSRNQAGSLVVAKGDLLGMYAARLSRTTHVLL